MAHKIIICSKLDMICLSWWIYLWKNYLHSPRNFMTFQAFEKFTIRGSSSILLSSTGYLTRWVHLQFYIQYRFLTKKLKRLSILSSSSTELCFREDLLLPSIISLFWMRITSNYADNFFTSSWRTHSHTSRASLWSRLQVSNRLIAQFKEIFSIQPTYHHLQKIISSRCRLLKESVTSSSTHKCRPCGIFNWCLEYKRRYVGISNSDYCNYSYNVNNCQTIYIYLYENVYLQANVLLSNKCQMELADIWCFLGW